MVEEKNKKQTKNASEKLKADVSAKKKVVEKKEESKNKIIKMKNDKKDDKKLINEETMNRDKIEETKIKEKSEEIKSENKKEDEKEEKKETKKGILKSELKPKEKAIANAYSLRISPKQSKFICKMIKGKSVERAIYLLEKVALGKLAVKMTPLEVGHQKGKGVSGARFPQTAAKEILNIVKQLKANCTVNSIEEPVISLAVSNRASAPMKRGGKKSKRTHLYLEAKDKNKLNEGKKK